jgi:hypothetical protein
MIKLPPWAYMFFRKTPYNYHGKIVLHFEHGKLLGFERNDFVDEQTFRERFEEVEDELDLLEAKQGELNGTQSHDVSATLAR